MTIENSGNRKMWYQSRDFWIGFLGWFIFQGLSWALLLLPLFEPQSMEEDLGIMCAGALFLLNIAVLIFLAIKKRMIAFGVLVAMSLNFAITLIQGAFYKGVCFAPFFLDTGKLF